MKFEFEWDEKNVFHIHFENFERQIYRNEIEYLFEDIYAIIEENKIVNGIQRYVINAEGFENKLITVIFELSSTGRIRPITAWKTHRGKNRKKYYENKNKNISN